MAPYRTSGCPWTEAVLALGTLDSAATREAVRLALGDPADPVRCAAVRVLHGGKTPTRSSKLCRSWPERRAKRSSSPAGLASLRELIDPREAADALVRADDDRDLSDDDVAMLAILLGDEDSQPKSETIDALIDALSDDRDAVVDRAADGLARPRQHGRRGRAPEHGLGASACPGCWEGSPTRARSTCWWRDSSTTTRVCGPSARPGWARSAIRSRWGHWYAPHDADHSVRMQAASALDEFGTAAVIVGVAELLRPLVDGVRANRARPSPSPKPSPGRTRRTARSGDPASRGRRRRRGPRDTQRGASERLSAARR